MRILVTGSNGYIGSSMSKYLKSKGYEVYELNRAVCDLLDKKQVDKYFENFTCDVVIHTAVVGGSRLKQEEESIISDNLEMFCNLLRHRTKYNKFIHFGSGAQINPNTFYGISKKAIGTVIDRLDSFYNIRRDGLFDENEIDTRFIKASVTRALNGQDIIIHKDRRMDFFHMKDLMTLVHHYIKDNNLEKNVDCSYKTSLTLKEIGSIIRDKCNPKIDIKVLNRGYENYWGVNTDYLNNIVSSDTVSRIEETIATLKERRGIK